LNKQKGVDKVYLTKYDVYRTNKKEEKQVNILAEVTIDETGIIKQMDAVKEAADKFEDEALKLRGMLAQIKATAKVEKEKAEEK
jgi:hypothetical protein